MKTYVNHDADPVQRLQRSWDANAHAWTSTVREHRIESRRTGTDRAIVEAVLRVSPARVLDVGCGEGWLCRELGRAGIRCVGIDGSTDLIAAARAANPEGRYEQVTYAELARLPESHIGAAFDAAVCNFSLLHDDIEPILATLNRLLRPDGNLLIQTVHPWLAAGDAGYVDGWRTEEFSWSDLPFPEPMPWYFRTLESWIAALSESGFHIEAITEPLHPETRRPLSLLLTARR